ncbi:MAG: PASTA domain-containing protein [Gemmatimonadales bacterium]|jgi:serine/threonine-protein kinase|nr:PASTA domain-containing protein [Gemmatimonadales bacterium]
MNARRLLRDLLVVLGLAAVAFAVTWLVLSPAPVLASSHAVPRVLELPYDEAERELVRAGFRARRGDSRLHPVRSEGTVTWQDPPAGMVLPAGSPVTLETSSGLVQYVVPDVQQFPVALARRVVAAAGLRVAAVDSLPSSAAAGTVLDVRPAVGAGLAAGGGVTLVIATPLVSPIAEAPTR